MCSSDPKKIKYIHNVQQKPKKIRWKNEPVLPRGILGKRTARTVVFSDVENVYVDCVFIALMVAGGDNMAQRKGMLYVLVEVVVVGGCAEGLSASDWLSDAESWAMRPTRQRTWVLIS